jgi:phosphonate transport system substrate-binding protein
VDVWRIGILGGENEADRLRNFACLAEHVETRFNVPVQLFPASDYAGVMQGLISKSLETAGLGSAAYAGIHLQDPDAVEPLVTNRQLDGSLGYYAIMVVRADSGIESLEDMRGRSLAFADPNSTSGYLVPGFELKQAGYIFEGRDAFFDRTGFSGGHEQSVVAVLNGQYDAGVVWVSGVGDFMRGYSRGILRNMVDKGAVDMGDLRQIWQSNLITNGPTVVRKDLPPEVKQAYRDFLVGLKDEDYDCYSAIAAGDADGFVPVDHDFYSVIIEMRREAVASRRG